MNKAYSVNEALPLFTHWTWVCDTENYPGQTRVGRCIQGSWEVCTADTPQLRFVVNHYLDYEVSFSKVSYMSELLRQLEEFTKELGDIKFPVAAVVRPDIYEQLKTRGEFKFKDESLGLGFPGSLPVLPDPAANSVAMAQTNECMMFYDNKALTLYLNRGNDPMAWVRYCCEQAGIPYPVDEKVSTVEKNG